VPFYGLEGAFMSFLLTNVLLTVVYFYYSFKEINFIKLISLKLFFLLSCYVLALFFISKDNFLHLSISILFCLLILLFTQKNLNKKNVKN
jgi:O-antigen/teichoic acid export membrane protein